MQYDGFRAVRMGGKRFLEVPIIYAGSTARAKQSLRSADGVREHIGAAPNDT